MAQALLGAKYIKQLAGWAGKSPLANPLGGMDSAASLTGIRQYNHHPDWRREDFIRISSTHLHGKSSEKNRTVEGVSDRQFPIIVQWERPKHPKRALPGAEASGDLEAFPTLDPSRRLPEFEGCQALEEAMDKVQRVFSLEFATRRDLLKRVSHDYARKVQRHPHDFQSLEVFIAILTARIRHAQAFVAKELEEKNRRRGAISHVIKIMVDQRRVLLGVLRQRDYKKFEFLLETLNIAYKPRPIYFEKIEREVHMVRLTELWCSELKQHRLSTLKHEFKSQQPEFLRDKAKKLGWIKAQEEELGLQSSVSQDEIQQCLDEAKRIEDILARQTQEDRMQKLFVYEEEVPVATTSDIAELSSS
ncbi:hypothetical protein TCAL_01599 [Tigriopus californicus]|uniref:Small ribosomal subunit protein uS15m n=1 Tax=Tigriopus californicus TaxID=6832 RepID=A0A553PBX8_TIGCA|nr:small ribosomal subunit protein uS15m-like [Tigriopus californicus]TRY75184.1 hypothetical protein TCAL_01599 [Tigriopus californicus]